MKITIKEDEEFNLAPVTQLCGMNVLKKRELLDAIVNYFLEKDPNCDIRVDGEVVGNEYFAIHHIRDKRDLSAEFAFSKNSMIYKTVLNYIHQFEAEKMMEQIDNQYAMVFQEINHRLSENIGKISVEYDLIKKNEELIKKCEVNVPENSGELLVLYINLMLEQNRITPGKRLIIIENIDFMIERQTYLQIIDYCNEIAKENDIWFLFSLSIPGFGVVKEELLDGITVVNDVIYSFDEVSYVKAYVEENYPIYREFSQTEIMDTLRECLHSLGSVYAPSVTAMVYDKMISSSMGIYKETKNENIKSAEIAYLNEKM